MIKNIILDLDGTLAKTHPDILSSLKFSLRKKKIKKKVNFKKFKSLANNGSYNMIKNLIGGKNNFLINELNKLFLTLGLISLLFLRNLTILLNIDSIETFHLYLTF